MISAQPNLPPDSNTNVGDVMYPSFAFIPMKHLAEPGTSPDGVNLLKQARFNQVNIPRASPTKLPHSSSFIWIGDSPQLYLGYLLDDFRPLASFDVPAILNPCALWSMISSAYTFVKKCFSAEANATTKKPPVSSFSLTFDINHVLWPTASNYGANCFFLLPIVSTTPQTCLGDSPDHKPQGSLDSLAFSTFLRSLKTHLLGKEDADFSLYIQRWFPAFAKHNQLLSTLFSKFSDLPFESISTIFTQEEFPVLKSTLLTKLGSTFKDIEGRLATVQKLVSSGTLDQKELSLAGLRALADRVRDLPELSFQTEFLSDPLPLPDGAKFTFPNIAAQVSYGKVMMTCTFSSQKEIFAYQAPCPRYHFLSQGFFQELASTLVDSPQYQHLGKINLELSPQNSSLIIRTAIFPSANASTIEDHIHAFDTLLVVTTLLDKLLESGVLDPNLIISEIGCTLDKYYNFW